MTRRLSTPVLLVTALLLAPRPAAPQPHTPNTKAVQDAVERFLDVVGRRDLEQLPPLVAPKATMTIVRQREGQWTTTHQTFEEYLAAQRTQAAGGPTFREPLTNVRVFVEDERLAFLRADFTIVVDGKVTQHGVDYFTLVKDGDAWKIIHAAFTNHPGPPAPPK